MARFFVPEVETEKQELTYQQIAEFLPVMRSCTRVEIVHSARPLNSSPKMIRSDEGEGLIARHRPPLARPPRVDRVRRRIELLAFDQLRRAQRRTALK